MSTSERMNSPPSLWRLLKLPWLLVDVACWSNCWGQRKLINQVLNDQHYNCNSFSCWISERCSIHCCHYTGNVSTKISCYVAFFFDTPIFQSHLHSSIQESHPEKILSFTFKICDLAKRDGCMWLITIPLCCNEPQAVWLLLKVQKLLLGISLHQ